MGTHTIRVPDVGEGVAEVELVAWTVAVGDSVTRNQVLAEVMTDKANVEIPAPVDGVIADLHGEAGEIMAVGSDLIRLTIDGDGDQTAQGDAIEAPAPTVVAPAVIAPSDRGITLPFPQPRGSRPPSAPVAGSTGGESSPTHEPATDQPATNQPAAAATIGTAAAQTQAGESDVTLAQVDAAGVDTLPGQSGSLDLLAADAPSGPNGRSPRAAPAVRRRARDLGIDLASISGTGPQQRVTHADLDRRLTATTGGIAAQSTAPATGGVAAPVPTVGPASTAPVPRAEGGSRVEPLIGLRRQIAQRMVTATTTIPHITYVEEVDVTAVEDLRATLNAERADGQPKLTLLPFLIRAMIAALGEHPQLNAHVDDEAGTLIVHDVVNVGIATQTDRGLLVPVVADAAARSLWGLADEISRVSSAARDRKASPQELSGSTITITSLGALGGVVTTPVINKPEVAIVGVNKIETRPVWDGSGFTPRRMMNLSSSFDHRVIDGFDAASFIQRVRAGLEQPALPFITSG